VKMIRKKKKRTKRTSWSQSTITRFTSFKSKLCYKSGRAIFNFDLHEDHLTLVETKPAKKSFKAVDS
jgi:hypothetical protein